MKKSNSILAVIIALGLAFISIANADVITLKNGTKVEGEFAGGTAGAVNFKTSQGMMVIDTSQAATLAFMPKAPPPAAAPTVAPPTGGPVSVPAGTLLLVRLDSTISSSSTSPGQRFSCKLESDLTANGTVVARAGTPVYGRVTKAKQAGRLAGKSELDLELSEINLGGQAVPVVTSSYAQAGQGEFRSTARNAALGAGIGAAFGGGEGAGKGAAIGGAASALKKGEAIMLPSGSLLEFRLTAPCTVTVR